jgi:hypothetical protein
MAPSIQPPDSADGEQKRSTRKQKRPAAPERKQLPDRAEVDRLVAELHAGLTSNDGETLRKAKQMCRSLSLRAVERLGLIIAGHQSATPPQVVMSSIAVLKGAEVVEKGDAGITAETTE